MPGSFFKQRFGAIHVGVTDGTITNENEVQ